MTGAVEPFPVPKKALQDAVFPWKQLDAGIYRRKEEKSPFFIDESLDIRQFFV